MTNRINEKETVLAKHDGFKYFFIHHKAKTDLGQLLSPLTYAPFKHPIYGRFDSVIGFSYWLQCGKAPKADALRQVHGTHAIKVGAKIKAEHGTFLSNREALREITYASLLKIQDHVNSNPDLTVSIKQEMASNGLPYLHVRNIRNSDKNSIYGKTDLARVRVLSVYNRLSEIYKIIGTLFRTEFGRSQSPAMIMQMLDNRDIFTRAAAGEEIA